MAQQITIDIVAETRKLTEGVNAATGELSNLSTGISKAQQAAVGLASAFILREGVSFLKKANDEAIDAAKTAKLAAIAFGEGSSALKKITDDADKFSKTLAVDNDDLIKLATNLSVNLPAAAKGSATELVNLGYDVAALKGIDIETWVTKFSKAMVDGNLSIKDMQTLVPDLSDKVYKQADALMKAGRQQDAINLLISEGQKIYGDAAESQVTGTQKMNKALGDLYETIGTRVSPIIEKLVGWLSQAIDFVTRNQAVIIPLVAVLGTFAAAILLLNAGLTAYNAIMSAWKVATTLATTAQTLFNAVLSANPIGLVIIAIAAIIAIIIILVKNWDTVTEAVGKVWDAIKDFASGAWNALKSFGSKVAGFVSDIISDFRSIPSEMLNIGRNIVSGLWNGIQSLAGWIKDRVLGFFGSLLPSWAKKALGISSPSRVFATIGKSVGDGLWTGLKNKENFLKTNFYKYFGDLIPAWAKKALQIASPSKVFIGIGDNVAKGLAVGITRNISTVRKSTDKLTNVVTTGFGTQKDISLNGGPFAASVMSSRMFATTMPTLSTTDRTKVAPVQITINAAPGTDLYALGRTVNNAVNKYSRISTQYGVKQQL